MTTTLAPQEPRTDADLVARARSGDVAAFDGLVERHFQSAYAIAWMRLRDREAAEELAQEVMLRAWLDIARLRDGAAFGGWVARMAHHLAIDWQRRRTRTSRLARMVPMEAPVENVIDPSARHGRDAAQDRQEKELLDRALAEMPREDRQIILLHFGQEMSHREIARRLDVHHTTIGRRIEKALDELRRVVDRQAAAASAPHPMRAASEARLHACALVAAAAVLAPEAKAAIAAAASATVPASLAAAEVSLAAASATSAAGGAATASASGVGAFLKAGIVPKVLAGLLLGGVGAGIVSAKVLLRAGHEAVHTADVRTEAARADRVLPYACGESLRFVLAPDEGVRVEFAQPAGLQIESILFSTGPDAGAVHAAILRTDGAVDEASAIPAPVGAAAPQESLFMRYLNNGATEAAEMLTFAADRRADGSIDVAVFANSNADFLPQSEAAFADYFEGRASQKDAAAKWLDGAEKAGLLPKDDAHRARVRGGTHRWTR